MLGTLSHSNVQSKSRTCDSNIHTPRLLTSMCALTPPRAPTRPSFRAPKHAPPPFLHSAPRHCCCRRRQSRNAATRTLFLAVGSHGSKFRRPTWQELWWDTLFPLLRHIHAMTITSSTDEAPSVELGKEKGGWVGGQRRVDACVLVGGAGGEGG